MALLSTSMRIRISKFVTKTLPVGHVMQARKAWRESFCPRCGCQDETPHHVLQCNEKSARKKMKQCMKDFEIVMERLCTERNLQTQIFQTITEWITKNQMDCFSELLPPLQSQKKLGWYHFMEGRIHSSFETHMDNYYRKIGSKKTGTMWTTVIIQSLWSKIFFPMWEHRNKAVHVVETKSKLTREHIDINSNVRELFKKAEVQTLLYQDKYLLEEPLYKLLKSPIGRKRGWILSIKIALRESEKSIICENMNMRNSMQRFRTTGTCARPQCNINTRPATRVPTPSTKRKRVKRHPKRKQLRPLLSWNPNPSRKRCHDQVEHRRSESRATRRRIDQMQQTRPKQHKNRRHLMPTIEEEWEIKNSVRKKMNS